MGLKRDIREGYEIWQQRPFRNSLLLLIGAGVVALGMAADAKWDPDLPAKIPVTEATEQSP